MSYDVSLTIDTGGEHPAHVYECGNMTSNVSPMWRQAMPPDGVAGLHGMKAADAIRFLLTGIDTMTVSPAIFHAMNPENEWGDYDGALGYLREILKGCLRHPRAAISVSR